MGRWNAPSDEEEKTTALEAKLANLEKRHKKKCDKRENNDNDNKTNNKKKFWKFRKPSDDKLKMPIKKNGLKWHWCSKETGGKCNGGHCHHKPSQCGGWDHLINKRRREESTSEDVSDKKGLILHQRQIK